MDNPLLLRRIANRAATLTERLAAPAQPAAAGAEALDGQAVIDAWRAALAAPSDDTFAARLAWQGLTPEAARAGASRLICTTGALPSWTTWLDLALADAPRVADELESLGLPALPSASGIDEPPFVELGLPWLRVARRALAERLPAGVPLPPISSLEAQWLREFGTYAGATLHQTFSHNLDGPAPAGTQTYDRFVRTMLRGGLRAFFDACPVVARHLSVITDAWVTTTAELCLRLSLDRENIETTFGGRPAGEVTTIEPALSDPHEGRRRVAIITFSGGLRVVYKPRNLAIESAFSTVLDWARAHGLEPAPRTLRVLDRGEYGWVEYAEPAGTFSHAGARRYYEQAGGLLCWAHVFRGRDLHMENVVATPSGPVLIDLEVLLQPVRADEQPSWPAADSGDAARLPPGAVSCLQTGLLTLLRLRDDGEVTDVGGLRGTPASLGAPVARVWRNLRTSAIVAVSEPAPPARVANAVRVRERPARPDTYRDDIVAGFAQTYRFILAHRTTLLAPDGPLAAMALGRVRVLPRNTDQYAQLLQALNAPRYQADGAVRSAWFDILARPYLAAGVRPVTWPLLTAERQQMEGLDVPRFWMEADGTTLFAGERPVLSAYVAWSGLAAARRQIASMSDADLEAQQARLSNALATSVETRFSVPFPAPAPAPDDAGIDAALRGAAITIGEALLGRLRTDARPGAPDSLDTHTLYRGGMGLPLFFAALAIITDDPRWRAAAESAVEPILGFVARDARPSASEPAGICAGRGSIVYGLGLMARLMGQPAYTAAALEAAASLEPAEMPPEAVDLVDGAAGAILALTSLFGLTAEPSLLARAAGFADRLVSAEHRTPAGSVWGVAGGRQFLGFAHGSAGIGTAAAALAAATNDDRWRELGTRAWRRLESSFDAAAGNWPVEHGAPGGGPMMTAWCHGSPGILIGAGRLLDFGRESAILTHANAAMTTLQRVSDHLDEHLCCGNLGRAEALLGCGVRIEAPDAMRAARTTALRVVERAARRQHVRLAVAGFEYPVFDSGFFRGLSGVGYQLLRLTAPSLIPSVLGFE